MFESDYIMRMIKQLSGVFARVLMLCGLKQPGQAQEELDAVALDIFDGLPGELLAREIEDYIQQFQEGLLSIERAWVGVQIIALQGYIWEIAKPNQAGKAFKKAFHLAMEMHRLSHERIPPEIDIAQLFGKAQYFHEDEEGFIKLIHYYYQSGSYALAEDMLFEWMDITSHPDEVLIAGERFYTDAQQRGDAALAQGNLARHELDEGFLALKENYHKRMRQEEGLL